MDKSGSLLCARYAVAPNFFGYCGPAKTASLIDYLKENIDDGGVSPILSEFETLYHYLFLIARENKIINPFDRRVVEAYWLGNDLLSQFDSQLYISLLEEKLVVQKKLDKDRWRLLKEKLNMFQPFPHHAFHVFNIFRRTGHSPSFQSLATMDACRIGWGKVIEIENNSLPILIVETRPLVFLQKRLTLGAPKLRQIRLSYRGKTFIPAIKKGSWVSYHWGFVCDVLTTKQVRDLKFYTEQSIIFYNSGV